jgi:hypothetical protein
MLESMRLQRNLPTGNQIYLLKLNTFAIQDCPFNGGSLNGVISDQLDSSLFGGTRILVPDQSRNQPSRMQKTSFPRLPTIFFKPKIRPVRLLAMPLHEL